MKSKKEIKQDFYNDKTNFVSLNQLCKTCKSSKKCYQNMNKLCLLKRLAIQMAIDKLYKGQENK